jgi:cobalt-zinc-cadmium efflux system membrane fusion protein
VRISITSTLWATISASILCGCHKSESSARPSASASNTTQAQAAVELSPSQLNAIKIEPVGTYLFPIEKEAAASVSFDEDPGIVQAESTLVAAAATFESTGKELARVKELGVTNGIPQKELEQAIADHQTASAALKAARDAVRALGKTDAEVDEMVATGKITAAGGERRWLLANVIESDVPIVRTGQPVEAKVAAFPERVFKGKVSKVYGTVDPSTHRMAIRCEIEDPKEELRPGMLAQAIIRAEDAIKATAIPAEGVARESDGTMTAWLTTDRRRFVQKVVKTGARRDGRVQILEGLKPGELAVTDGAVFLNNMLNAPPSD